jgi:hypothetical protein
MGIFRFIDGGKGLDPTPFLTFDYRTVRDFQKFTGISDTRLWLCRLRVELGTLDSYAISNLRWRSIYALQLTQSSENFDLDPQWWQLRKTRIKFSYNIQQKMVRSRLSKQNFWWEQMVRRDLFERNTWSPKESRWKRTKSKSETVEKRFLADCIGRFRYEAVWVALNWHLTLPTPETHPTFPLWKEDYSPEDVYDLFFPRDFNFICDPARPSVCGRFGRTEDRLWRFEFVVKDGEDGHKMATPEETRKIIMPYLTHRGSRYG